MSVHTKMGLRFGFALARDLFAAFARRNTKQVPFWVPYPAADFFSRFVDGLRSTNDAVTKQPRKLEDRLQQFERHMKSYELTKQQLMAVVCGGGNMHVPIGKLAVQQDVLRGVGRAFYTLKISTSTVFTGINHLSPSHEELQHLLSAVDDQLLVCDYMRLNLLYNHVLPYRGGQSAGKKTKDAAGELREGIMRRSVIGSFHTMLGIVVYRYGHEAATEFFHNRVLEGPQGMMKLVNDRQR